MCPRCPAWQVRGSVRYRRASVRSRRLVKRPPTCLISLTTYNQAEEEAKGDKETHREEANQEGQAEDKIKDLPRRQEWDWR